jgi:deoxyribodipyrimidine photo-lyase
VNQSLINACSKSTQTDSWLKIERDEFLTMVTPPHLEVQEPFSLHTEYPDTDIDTVSGSCVCLYTPWTLDPLWRTDETTARRILVIEPLWFDRYPVSPSVLDFIIRQGQTVIPDLEVYVGSVDDLPGIRSSTVYFKDHQTNQHWSGTRETNEKIFPEVSGYYQSFYKYWQEAKKYL